MIKIKDFEERQKIEAPLLIVGLTKGVSNNGQPYLSLTLQDNSSSIEGKLWDVSEELSAKVQQGHIVEVVADVIKYRNNLQLKIQSLDIKNQKGYQLSDFIMTSSIPKEQLSKEIFEYVDSIEDDILKSVVTKTIESVKSQYFVYPAATRNHHEFVGGLATHTLEMCKLADKVLEVFPHINRDLLMSGILLHDVSKIEEYVSPVVVEYSTPGKLLGHISMAQAKVYEIATHLGVAESEQVMLLRHLILSHHGEYEFGSPVLPLVVEAEVLNIIDNLSARVYMFEKNTESIDEGAFSTRVFSLEGRTIYKPQFTKKNQD